MIVRHLPLLLALLVLTLGGAAIGIHHAPVTTWAVPVAVGPLVDDVAVWSIRRTPTDVRLEVGTATARGTIRIVDGGHPDGPAARFAAGTKLLAEGDVLPGAAALDAVAARLEAHAARWPRPPAFVQPLGLRTSTRQAVEEGILQLVLVGWIAGLLATVRRWGPSLASVSRGAWAAVAGLLVVRHVALAALDVPSVWHSNFHGFDRVADIVQGTPPHAAALGLLHGYGTYVLLQPLHALWGGSVPWLGAAVTSGTLLVAFAWMAALFDDEVPAVLGVGVLVTSAVVLRVGASESMYVPATLYLLGALWAFERHLGDDDAASFLLALPPAFLAMQTRAELMVVVPLWAGLSMLFRRPSWLRTAWRRPAVVGGLVVCAALFVPRGIELLEVPPPSDLRRAAFDPLADPRVVVLAAAAALAGCAAVPPLWRRVAATPRGARALAVVVPLSVYAAWLRATGGPLEPTWQIHPALDPAFTAPWIPALALFGAVRSPRPVAAALGLWFVSATWIVLPLYDCLSTYARTSLVTWPVVAALAGAGLAGAWRAGGPGRTAGVALLLGAFAWGAPWAAHRYPKQWMAVQLDEVRARIPAGSTIVALSEDDAPADAAARGFRTTRQRLGHHLGPGYEVRPLRAWLSGEVSGEAWFVRTADCARVLLAPRGGVALAGEREVPWRYRDVSEVATVPRIDVDVPADWMDPSCAAALAGATPVWEQAVPREVAGSVYETLVGAPPVLGIYRLPARGRARQGARSEAP